jgi:ActR/RegA family two-component response regulator
MSATERPVAHKVLLVDDDDAVRAMMNATLERKGFDVVAAAKVTVPSTILVRQRCRIMATLSFSIRAAGLRASIFSRTSSASLPTSNGFTMISSASRRLMRAKQSSELNRLPPQR